MSIVGIHHAQIATPSNSEKAVRGFYGGVLGLRELPVPPTMPDSRLIWFAVGNCEIHIAMREDGVDRSKTRAHLAYEVDDIEVWKDRLAAHGVELVEQGGLHGYMRGHFHDPFGNRIEILGRRNGKN